MTKRGRICSKQCDDQGFANVVVLVGLLAVSGLITASLVLTTETAATARIVFDRLADESAASSATAAALMTIRYSPPDLQAERPISLSIGERAPVAVNLIPESGRLNPLLTYPEVLRKYAESVSAGEAREAVAGMSRTTAPRRDSSYTELLKGLLAVPGNLSTDFTPFNPLPGVDPANANERVLSALPDLSLFEVARILASEPGEPAGVQSAYFETGTQRYSIVATITQADGSTFERQVPFELSSTGATILLGRAP